MDVSRTTNSLILLAKRAGLIFLLLSISRIIFLLFNLSHFRPVDLVQLFRAFFFGLRFDFVVFYYFNSLFILLHLFPFRTFDRPLFQNLLKAFIVAVNAVLLLLNFIDIGYFGFTNKRSGWELFEMLQTSSDILTLIPSYFLNYWYLFLFWLGTLYLLVVSFPKYIDYNLSLKPSTFMRKVLLPLFSIALFVSGLAIARGLDTKPVRMITANKYVVPKYIPLLLNTPFTIINTIAQSKEGVNDFYALKELPSIYSPVHKYNSDSTFRKMNVVIFILESFGKEYTEARSRDGRSFTPFLDSLKSVGLYCSNAYANASRSMDAMPPILGGFPSLLRTSFVNSAYSVNKISGLATLLRNKKYETAFFHGGHNGTMGFDMFAYAAGFKAYFGKNEYNNDADFDGGWGIWDEPFFEFMANKVNTFEKPFLSVLFSLSSHDPYPLPDKLKETLFPGEPKILRSVAYTDYSLQKFFETASKMKWYKNTLFVIVPDHTSLAFSPEYGSLFGKSSIPIIYYCPTDTLLKGNYSDVTQQLDIMPTVLNYLHYENSFTSYGKSIFEPGYRFSVSFNGTNYQIIDSSRFMLFDGNHALQLNHFRTDSLLEKNLINIDTLYQNGLEIHLKAYLQEYFLRLNNNALSDTVPINKLDKKL